MLAALLPSVSPADAEAVSGNPEAPLVLDYVYRRHLFTDRRRIGDRARLPVPRAVPRVPAGRGQAPADRATSGRRRSTAPRASSSRAATSTPPRRCTSRRRRGRRWSASRCTRAARCSPKAAARRSCAGSPRCPPRCAKPSRGCARRSVRGDVRRARARKALLERAFDGFVARGDVRRQLLVAAAAVDCHYFEWADFAPLDRWIDDPRRSCSIPDPHYLSTADALRMRGALLIALLFRQPDHPRIDDAARDVEALLAAPDIETVPVNDRVNAASILFNYMNWKTKGDERRRADRARRAVARRSRGDRRQPRVVAGASRVQRADPRPLRALAEDHEGHRGVRGRARAEVGAGRDLPRGGDGARVERGRRRAPPPRSPSCAPCSIRRGAWTSRTSATRKRAC